MIGIKKTKSKEKMDQIKILILIITCIRKRFEIIEIRILKIHLQNQSLRNNIL